MVDILIADDNIYYAAQLMNYINKTSTIQEIISRIEELIINKTKKEQEKRIKNKITNELLYLGYNISHKGTSYLFQVIRYIKLNPKYEVDNLSKNVYPIIAKYYNEKVHNIKCYIQRETAEMYANCDIDKLKRYFKYTEDYKPNVKEVIYIVETKFYYDIKSSKKYIVIMVINQYKDAKSIEEVKYEL